MNAMLPAAPAAGERSEPPVPLVSWIRDAPQKAICDVPWLGGSIVMSSGDVYFCCFSGAKVGNVNEASFQEIWNGGTMQRIRQSLVAGSLPPECRSGSCPIFRGDDRHYLIERMNSRHVQLQPDGEQRLDDTITAARASLQQGRLQVQQSGGAAEPDIRLQIDLACSDLGADLFVAIDGPAGGRLFLPCYDFAAPYALSVDCSKPLAVEFSTADQPDFMARPGIYRICAALFEPGSNPSILANCYWAGTGSFRIA